MFKTKKYLLGVLIGAAIAFLLIWGYRKTIQPYYTVLAFQSKTNVQSKIVIDTLNLKKSDLSSAITELRLVSNRLEEQINSTNKRFDDLLIFGGIIITLLLAINISVYIKAENEVARHLNEHIDKYKDKITKQAQDVESLLTKAQAEVDIIKALRVQHQAGITP